MSNSISTRVAVLGSGPAGLTAAIYAARAGLGPVVIQGIQPGGQLTTTTDVENYPGFRDVIQGPWLMEEMQAQAEHVGTKVVWDHISAVDLSRRPFRLTGDSGAQYFADALVIATGAQAKWLGLPSEEHMKGRGASACATCDGFFYRGKKVAVIGGGNTAVEEALYLTNHSHDVTLIHRRDSASRRENPAGPAVRQSQHQDHLGQRSRRVRRRRRARGAGRPRHPQQAVRRGQPHRGRRARSSPSATSPRPSCSRVSSTSTSDGYILVEPGTTRTSIEGVFACGDVMDKIYRQAVTAAGTGCMAALDAEKYLAAQEYEAIAAE